MTLQEFVESIKQDILTALHQGNQLQTQLRRLQQEIASVAETLASLQGQLIGYQQAAKRLCVDYDQSEFLAAINDITVQAASAPDNPQM